MRRLFFFFVLFLTCTESFAGLPDLIPYRKGNLWGYCDSTKKMIIPAMFQYADLFIGKTASAELNDKWGIIDTTGKWIIPPKYYWVEVESHNGKRLAEISDEHCGLIDEHDSVLIPFTAQFIIWESDEYLSVVVKSSLAIYRADGTVLLPFDYVGMDCGSNGTWIYNRGSTVDSGLFVVYPKKLKTWAVIDSTGKVIISGFDFIFYFDGIFECETKDGYEYYDCRGNHLEDYLLSHPPPERNQRNYPEDESGLISKDISIYHRLNRRSSWIDGRYEYEDHYGTKYYED